MQSFLSAQLTFFCLCQEETVWVKYDADSLDPEAFICLYCRLGCHIVPKQFRNYCLFAQVYIKTTRRDRRGEELSDALWTVSQFQQQMINLYKTIKHNRTEETSHVPMKQQQTVCINLLIAVSIKCLDDNNNNNISLLWTWKWNLHMTTDTLITVRYDKDEH